MCKQQVLWNDNFTVGLKFSVSIDVRTWKFLNGYGKSYSTSNSQIFWYSQNTCRWEGQFTDKWFHIKCVENVLLLKVIASV